MPRKVPDCAGGECEIRAPADRWGARSAGA